MTAGTQEAPPTTFEDLEPILPRQGRLEIQAQGADEAPIPVKVARLRTREVFSLARVIGVALGSSILDLDVDWTDADSVKANVAGMLLVALPAAVDETLVFFRDVLRPVNSDDEGRLRAAMANPDFGDLMDVIDVIVDQEADDLSSLVGKAQKLAPKLAKFIPESKPGPDDRGPEPLTSSPTATDGTTTGS